MLLIAHKETYRVEGKHPSAWDFRGYPETTKDTWLLPPGRRVDGALAFPEGLVENALNLFTVPGDVGSDGKVNGIAVTMGRNFADNKGNATVFFGYKKEDEVSQKNRDFSACSLNDGDNLTCAGSSTTFPGRFRTIDPVTGTTGPNFTIADAAGLAIGTFVRVQISGSSAHDLTARLAA